MKHVLNDIPNDATIGRIKELEILINNIYSDYLASIKGASIYFVNPPPKSKYTVIKDYNEDLVNILDVFIQPSFSFDDCDPIFSFNFGDEICNYFDGGDESPSDKAVLVAVELRKLADKLEGL